MQILIWCSQIFHQSSKSLTLHRSIEQPGKYHPSRESATSLSVPEKLHFPHLINDSFALIVPRGGICFNTTQLKISPHSGKEFSMYIFKYVTSYVCMYERILYIDALSNICLYPHHPIYWHELILFKIIFYILPAH